MPQPPVTDRGSSNQQWGGPRKWGRTDGPSIVYGVTGTAWPQSTIAHACDWMKPQANRAVWRTVFFHPSAGKPYYMENDEFGHLENQHA